MAKTLATLKTFSKFDWKDLAVVMDEDEYEGYKSWYLYYKDQSASTNPKVPVPVDVDFDIELVRTDRINVVYILNLLKKAQEAGHTKSEEEKQHDVDLILTEGFKFGAWKKILLVRRASGKPPALDPETCFAVVSDVRLDTAAPQFSIEDAEGLADFLLHDKEKEG